MSSDRGFHRQDRLLRAEDYDRVFARKCSVRGKWLVIHGCENPVNRPRLGRVVGTRWGGASERTRYRRWIREVFRTTKSDLPKVDYVIMIASTQDINYQQVEAELPRLAERLAARLQGSSK